MMQHPVLLCKALALLAATTQEGTTNRPEAKQTERSRLRHGRRGQINVVQKGRPIVYLLIPVAVQVIRAEAIEFQRISHARLQVKTRDTAGIPASLTGLCPPSVPDRG